MLQPQGHASACLFPTVGDEVEVTGRKAAWVLPTGGPWAAAEALGEAPPPPGSVCDVLGRGADAAVPEPSPHPDRMAGNMPEANPFPSELAAPRPALLALRAAWGGVLLAAGSLPTSTVTGPDDSPDFTGKAGPQERDGWGVQWDPKQLPHKGQEPGSQALPCR